jgi:hypothetical protein
MLVGDALLGEDDPNLANERRDADSVECRHIISFA